MTVAERPLLDKLGVRLGQRVCVLGVDDGEFLRALRARLGSQPYRRPVRDASLIFYAADDEKALTRLSRLRVSLVPNGAIWVVSLKGKAARIKDTAVMAAAKQAGLVDNKVVAFSETHTALRLVIPLALRPA